MVTDLKYLQQMTGNNNEIMKEMIELFLAQLAETQVEFDSLLVKGEWLELSRLAHKMKSSALVMGIELMANEMIELEVLAKEATHPEKCRESIARFNSLTDRTREELENCLASLA
ncbi:MAG: Hpt domain-containing protein [Bacteroidales bacterium]|jgi:HPt (histidine-containing phosphotransfer) domain-containing protein|nr:Hpt domain-containing protein [Bacteroidales bacterium]